MKNSKRLTAILLAILMVCSMAFTAMAVPNGTDGVITIKNVEPNTTYTVYQIAKLESYSGSTSTGVDDTPHAYKVTSAWEPFLRTEATSYVTVDTQGYVTWKDSANTEAFAKAALAYAKDHSIGYQGSKKSDNSATPADVQFTGLNYGWYLVDTSVGSLCSLGTTDKEAVVIEKNKKPTVEKKVKEDNGEAWLAENSAQIGDTIYFETTIHAHKGAENYVLHDAMGDGFTLNTDTVAVAVGGSNLTVDTDYTLVTGDATGDGCDFHITFTKDYLDDITVDTNIVVTYNALLNKTAKIADATNDNSTWLVYGDGAASETTEPQTTKTSTYKFDIVKTDSDFNLLDGAKFELYDAATDGNKIFLVKDGDVYRVATEAEKVGDSAIIEATGGRATVVGLDLADPYYLQEVKQPEGYNILKDRADATLTTGNNLTTMEGTTWAEGKGGVQITNQNGTELPTTGGMGTTVLYIVGGILVAGAAVLLITKKRMGANR